jgi:hypothetical protein
MGWSVPSVFPFGMKDFYEEIYLKKTDFMQFICAVKAGLHG